VWSEGLDVLRSVERLFRWWGEATGFLSRGGDSSEVLERALKGCDTKLESVIYGKRRSGSSFDPATKKMMVLVWEHLATTFGQSHGLFTKS